MKRRRNSSIWKSLSESKKKKPKDCKRNQASNLITIIRMTLSIEQYFESQYFVITYKKLNFQSFNSEPSIFWHVSSSNLSNEFSDFSLILRSLSSSFDIEESKS